jgi:MraZ protein
MWLGESTHALDDKGRLSVPRRLLSGQGADAGGRIAFVVTAGFEGALFLFTEAAFASAVSRLDTQAFAGEAKRRMQRLFFSKAQRVELDEKNRLLLPAELKEFAGLEREVTLVGLIDRAEIWSKAKWDAYQEAHAGEFGELDRVLSGSDAGGEPAAPAGGKPAAPAGGKPAAPAGGKPAA